MSNINNSQLNKNYYLVQLTQPIRTDFIWVFSMEKHIHKEKKEYSQ